MSRRKSERTRGRLKKTWLGGGYQDKYGRACSIDMVRNRKRWKGKI